MSRALVGLGSNLGDRAVTLSAAVAALGSTPGLRVLATSSWHETAPVGGPPNQPLFLNAAAVLDCSLDPNSLLDELQRIEIELGRRRDAHWGARTLDLDLLLFDDQVIDSPRLMVPHPWMALRRFVLTPAAEVAADWLHPVVGWTLERLLAHLDTAANYVALCGIPASGKTAAAQQFAAARAARLLCDPRRPRIGASGPQDPTGQVWTTEIEFLARRQQLLSAEKWGKEPVWTVSDFWFGQGLAYSALHWTPDEMSRYRELWLAEASTVVAPKLLVLLDPPRETTLEEGLLRGKIVELANQPGQGPMLRLSDPDTIAVAEQLGAAVDAMQ